MICNKEESSDAHDSVDIAHRCDYITFVLKPSYSISCILRLMFTCKVLLGSIFKTDYMTLQMPNVFPLDASTKYIFKTKHLPSISKETHAGCRTIRTGRLTPQPPLTCAPTSQKSHLTPWCVHIGTLSERVGEPAYM